MDEVVFDLEADGFLDDLTAIHCVVLGTPDGEITHVGTDNEGIRACLRRLSEADRIIGHNVIKYDIPALAKTYDFSCSKSSVFDTFVASRLIHSDEQGHSLRDWGFRLGNYKGDFKGPWDTLTDEMVEYCQQDVRVTAQVYQALKDKTSEHSIWLEHEVAWIISEQYRQGFAFDLQGAERLIQTLQGERAVLRDELMGLFDPWVAPFGPPKTVARDVNTKAPKGKTVRYAGAEYQPIKHVVFNPNSGDHIASRLKAKYGWKPKKHTPSGKPAVDEEVLGKLKYPEAQKLTKAALLTKRLALVSDGDGALLKNLKWHGDHWRCHGDAIVNGAITGRMTHKVVANVPRPTSEYGHEIRNLFIARPGFCVVGCDVSGLELRMLAHYMRDPDYTREVVEGDVHTANMEAAGLSDRQQAKIFIYAFLYGAGDAKIGRIVGGSRTDGRDLRRRFLERVPSLGRLVKQVKAKAEATGKLKGLDGRTLHIRSPHAALNTLLQSAGAIVCKQWVVEVQPVLRAHGGSQVLFYHDEVQAELPKGCDLGECTEGMVRAISDAGRSLGVRVPLTGEAKVGSTWAETH